MQIMSHVNESCTCTCMYCTELNCSLLVYDRSESNGLRAEYGMALLLLESLFQVHEKIIIIRES